MQLNVIISKLHNAGLVVKGVAGDTLIIEEPGCIVRTLDKFLGYAWVIITLITAILIFGWAISKIRGAKTDVVTNFRNLVLIFGILSASRPIIGTIYHGNISDICSNIRVSVPELQELLASQNNRLSNNLDLYDSLIVTTIQDTDEQMTDEEFEDLMRQIENDFEEDDDIESFNNTYTQNSGYTNAMHTQYFDFDNLSVSAQQLIINNFVNNTPGFNDLSESEQQNMLNNLQNKSFELQELPPSVQNEIKTSANTGTVKSASAQSNTGDRPSNAKRVAKRKIIYTNPDGTKTQKSRGTVSWRNNNPGNIVYGDWAKRHGAIATDGKFAIFPSEEVGFNAIIELLRSDGYKNLNIARAIHKYAPAADKNNPVKYARDLSARTGIPLTKPLHSLTNAELNKIAQEIKKIEGWRPGKTTQL